MCIRYIDIISSETVVNWYDSPSGGNLLTSGLTFVPTNEGLYYAQVLNVPDDGCKSELVPFELQVNPVPMASLTVSSATCVNEPITFVFDGIAETDAIYTWGFGESNTLDGIGPHTYTWEETGEQNISLTVEQNGCVDSYTDIIEISEIEVGLNASDVVVNVGTEVSLNALAISAIDEEVTYTWSSTGNLPDCLNCPETSVVLTQNSNITVMVMDDYGCSDFATASLGVVYPQKVIVADAFTPNGDGVNDYFGIIPLDVDYLDAFEIYGRLGNKLFSTNQLNESWDGTYKFVPQDIGVYTYFIKGVDTQGKAFLVRGSVLLVR